MKVGDVLRIWFEKYPGRATGGPYVAEIELLHVYSLPPAAKGRGGKE